MGLGGAIIGLAGIERRAIARRPAAFGDSALLREIRAIEAASGGRLGVAVRDTGSGARFAWRGGERFPMCSTFKFLLAAAVLARVDRGAVRLDATVPVRAADIIDHSPTTERHVGDTIDIATLCEATLTQSDNAAANLLLPYAGGFLGFNRFVRLIGDQHTRLDRAEPELNQATPGDPRDTTTPTAMLGNLDRLLLGSILSIRSRRRLTDWLITNQTGDRRLRGGLPAGWRVGDKTGSARTTTNDIAILWPPSGAPILVTAYLTEAGAEADRRDAAIAAVGAAVARARGR